MSIAAQTAAPVSPVGRLLKHWRGARRMSQLDLALEAGISTRHLSFVETGRAQPSRDMLLTLAEALDIPLRERNDILDAAGYARFYRDTALDDPAMAPEMVQVRKALDLMLANHEPYPCLVVDGVWNIRMVNQATGRMLVFFLGPETVEALAGAGAANAMELLFDPAGLRPYVVGWENTARSLLSRAQREAFREGDGGRAGALIDTLLAYPGVPADWRTVNLQTPLEPVLTMTLAKGDVAFNYFTTITTFGTPLDAGLQDLHIESFFPADAATEAAVTQLTAKK
jgi:transcriptional regulator with XRE-family HTH domain